MFNTFERGSAFVRLFLTEGKQAMKQDRSIRVAFTCGLLLAATCRILSAADQSPDITAKYLAGLAAPAASADTPADASPWEFHAHELDRAWQRTEQRQLPAIANWAPGFLGEFEQSDRPVFYMFSGPDFLYAHAFFPNARTYILCGTEPVGAVPDLNAISPETLSGTLANLRTSLDSVLSWSFFITKNMKTDLTRTQLSGTLPLLYVFLARTGYTIDAVHSVALNKAGDLIENGTDQTPGVRISVTNASGIPQTVYYFCSDLSDSGVKSKPGFLRFCANQGRGASLLKAASYLMHEPGFSQVRQFLLAQSDMILQDDSGIPLRYFDDQNWSIRYCGRYVGPIDIFKQYWQRDLATAYSRVAPVSLPFSFGYQWQPNRSDLLIATRGDIGAGTQISDRANVVPRPERVFRPARERLRF
jgi:hypothetical protein